MLCLPEPAIGETATDDSEFSLPSVRRPQFVSLRPTLSDDGPTLSDEETRTGQGAGDAIGNLRMCYWGGMDVLLGIYGGTIGDLRRYVMTYDE